MAEEAPVPGSGSCIRCRGPMPIGSLVCPTCFPASPEPTPPSTPPAPTESLVNSPFVVALSLTIMFLFLASYRPHEMAKERAEPLSLRSEKVGKEADELKAWSEEMRRQYIDPYGGYPTVGVSPEQLRAVLDAQLERIDQDPHLTKEQRRQIRIQLDRLLGAAGAQSK